LKISFGCFLSDFLIKPYAMNLKDTSYLVLGSRSPRRRDLLEQLGIKIKIAPSDIDETQVTVTSPIEYAGTLAKLKAEATGYVFPDDWVLGADTIVVVDDQVLGKPKSKDHALSMLEMLNNRKHLVYTGFCLLNRARDIQVSRVVGTCVEFKYCSREEFDWYIDTKEPFGKAGAYAIQGKGAFMVKAITGSYSNVVGLPVCEVVEEMITLNLISY
jgi:septum formation protein